MNPLKVNDIAHNFSLPNQDGAQIHFSDQQRQRVLIYCIPKR